MIPRIYQAENSEVAADILRKHMIVYLAWEERTGKSLTGILTAELLDITNVLIITKRKALGSVKEEEGWADLLVKFEHEKNYTLTTYGKATQGDYDLIIIDEAHNYISGYPKPSSTWKKLRLVCRGKPIIYMSATPHAQGYQLLYHQLALSTWSPWNKYSNFYNWHKTYGIPYTIKIGQADNEREVNKYDRCDEALVKSCIDHLFITKTRKELGFDHEPEDRLHYIELDKLTKKLYNSSMKDKLLVLGDSGVVKLLDTTMTMRASLHMLEGGTAKVTSSRPPSKEHDILKISEEHIAGETLYHTYYNLLFTIEKINFILDTWGDTKDVAIMYNYIGEEFKLKRYFKNARILQATSNAEGVELSDVEHLVIYSQDFSTARHTQRRARQASKQRGSPIRVHFLLVEKAISHQVYKTVSINKVNYVDSRFEKEIL